MQFHAPILRDADLTPLVAPLIATKDALPIGVEGTAFVIAPGWALTAAHVVREYIARTHTLVPQIDACVPANHQLNPRFELRIALPGTGDIVEVIPARGYSFSAKGDICLLYFDAAQYDWSKIGSYPVLRLSPPQLGAPVSAFGLPSTSTSVSATGKVKINLDPSKSVGFVREVHIKQRDNTMLNFPCFQFSARVLGGMSGGPVVDDSGFVCGVICSSQELADTVGEPISYGSTLWHAVTLPADGHQGEAPERPRFIDLLDAGIVVAVDRHHVELKNRGSDAMATTWQSNPQKPGTP